MSDVNHTLPTGFAYPENHQIVAYSSQQDKRLVCTTRVDAYGEVYAEFSVQQRGRYIRIQGGYDEVYQTQNWLHAVNTYNATL